MNHNDNPIKVIKTEASGTKQTIGELFPNQLPYQTITIDVKPICVAFAEWLDNNNYQKVNIIGGVSVMWYWRNADLNNKYTTEQLFDIFIKEYKP